jgi:phytoene synthase
VSGRDTNFYYSFFVLPPSKRQAIIAVWDFCRVVDDAVDEAAVQVPAAGSPDPAACQIAEWRQELARCFGDEPPRTWQGHRLKPFIRRFNLPQRAFEDVIDGVAMDLGHQRYRTFDALYQYCLCVASAVGLICVEIFGYRDDRARQYAVELGVALQLTNIIRDVAVDLAEGRLYLPLEDLSRFGCTEADLRKGQVTEQVRALLRFECDRARTYYERASRVLPAIDARRLIAARIMGAIYYEILQSVERTEYDVFSRIIRVPRPRRAVIAASTWARALLFG